MKKTEHKSFSIPRVFLLVLGGTLILGQLQRVQITSTVGIYLHEIVLVCLYISTFISFPKESITSLKLFPKAWMQWVLWIGASLYFARLHQSDGMVVGLLYWVRLIGYSFLYPVISVLLSKKIINHQRVRLGLLLLSLGIAVLGLSQYLFFPDMRFLQLAGWDDHYLRLASTLFDPPFTAAVIGLGSLLLLPLKKKFWKWFGWIFLVVTLLLTYSRASYLGFVAAYLAYGCIDRTKLKFALISILFLLLGMFFLPRPASEGARLERVVSIQARTIAAESTLKGMTIRDTVFGRGWYVSGSEKVKNNAIEINRATSSDNSYLHVFESTGFIGLFFFGIFVLQVIKRLYPVHIAMLSCFVFIGVSSVFNNVLFHPWIMIYLWTLFAVTKSTSLPLRS
jgi:hypothetical protein